MLFDEINEDRRKMLDEIRLRAEEAELARIEAQEIQLRDQLSEMISATPLPTPPVKDPSPGQKIEDLREPSGPGPEAADESTSELKQKNDRIADLRQSANLAYQQEKYRDSLGLLTEALSLDPQNIQVLALKAEVEKARDLIERLQEDRTRRKQQDVEAEKQHPFPPPKKIVDQNLPTPEAAFNDEPFRVPVPPPRPQSSSPAKRNIRRSLKWFAFVGLTVLGIFAAFVVFQNVRERFLLPTKSLLVLPVHSAEVPEYLTESMTGELITQLSQIKTLQVFGTKTALVLGSKQNSKAPDLLKAEYFLELDIEQTGEPLTLRFNLVKAATSSSVFNRQIKVSRDKLGAFLGDIIPDLAKAMDAENEIPNSAFTSSSTNGNAFDAYLRGRYLLQHPELASPDSVIHLFDLSRKQEPTFSEAEAALGWTRVLRYNASRDTARTNLNEANKNLQRAINLGAKDSEVYRLWGWIEYHRSNFGNAVERFLQATTSAPSDAEAYRGLSLSYLRIGKSDEALDAASLAASVDPLNSDLRRHFAMILRSQRRNTEALQEFEADFKNAQSSDLIDSDAFVGCLLATNHPERAIDILKDRAQMYPRNFMVFYELGRALQLAGKSQSEWNGALQQSLRIISDTLKKFPTYALAYSYRGLVETRLGLFSEGYVSGARSVELAPTDITILYNSARMYALQRSKSVEALGYLTKAIDHRFDLESLLDLDLTNLQSDPTYKAMLGN